MKIPRIEVVCIGTELLTGHADTHTAYLGRRLAECGLKLTRSQAVGDDPALMKDTFSEIFRRSDVVIAAGGLGPTYDDITRDVWSKVLKRPLLLNKYLFQGIREKFKSRNLTMPPANKRQAQVLRGAEVLENPAGTAPGQFLKMGNKIVILLPGPARELVPMVESQVIPRLEEIYPGRSYLLKAFHIVGVPESKIDHIIRPWVNRTKKIMGCAITHGILAHQSIITVKFIVEGPDPASVQRAIRKLSDDVRKMLGQYIFGQDNDTLEGVIGRLLLRREATLAVAESCTGGLIAKIITDQSGSSEYFIEGATVYQNESKISRLGVKPSTLKKFGAVSSVVAREMAEGLRKKTKVDYAVSVTGIAGPNGGTPEKPVGLVFIGCAGLDRTVVKRFQFTGDRAWIRHRAALMALDILRQEIVR